MLYDSMVGTISISFIEISITPTNRMKTIPTSIEMFATLSNKTNNMFFINAP